MAKKFYCRNIYQETAEFGEHEYDKMIAWYKKQKDLWQREPSVIFGEKLEFEPAVVVETWKAKDWG